MEFSTRRYSLLFSQLKEQRKRARKKKVFLKNKNKGNEEVWEGGQVRESGVEEVCQSVLVSVVVKWQHRFEIRGEELSPTWVAFSYFLFYHPLSFHRSRSIFNRCQRGKREELLRCIKTHVYTRLWENKKVFFFYFVGEQHCGGMRRHVSLDTALNFGTN